MIESHYPLRPLGEVLELDRDEVEVQADETYRVAGIYSFGRGLFERESVLGSQTAYRTLFRLSEGQVVISRLNGWEGAIAVVQPELDGVHVSNEYPAFSIRPNEADPAYVRLLMGSPALWADLAPRGSMVRRKRVQPSQLLELQVPLPDIDEQRRVAHRVEEALIKTDQVLSRQGQIASFVRLASSAIGRSGADLVRVGDVVKQVRRATEVSVEDTYRMLGVRWYGDGLFIRETKPGNELAAKAVNLVKTGDFVYNRLFAWKGSFAVATTAVDGCFVSNEFPTFVADDTRLDPCYLGVAFLDPERWSEVDTLSTGGTPTSRNRLKEQRFLDMTVPLPSIEEQRAIAQRAQVIEAGQRLNSRAEILTRALRPSILNQAFAGLL